MMATQLPEDGDNAQPSTMATGLRLTLAALGSIFFTGSAAGFLAAHDWSVAPSIKGAAVGLLLVALAALSLWQLGKGLTALSRRPHEEVAPSVRTSTRMTWIAWGLGVVFAIVLLLGEKQLGQSEPSILSNAPIPAWAAISLIVISLTVVPWLTFVWHRSVDEFEWQAYRDGALAAIYAYSALSVCWWLAWRAALLPAVDGLIVFFVTYVAWTVVWLWRRRT